MCTAGPGGLKDCSWDVALLVNTPAGELNSWSLDLVSDDAPDKVLAMILGAAPDHWSSITVDRREGLPMEWEVRNAVVGRLGRRYGIPTPLNDAITALLRAADVGAAP